MTFNPTAVIESMRVSMMNTEQTLALSSGEVSVADTMNYRTLAPEPGGLFCQRIFGPVSDGRCACGKTSEPDMPESNRCSRCGVEFSAPDARRTRFGHISLASPVCHIWRYRGAGNHISTLTGIAPRQLDKIVHHTHDIVISADQAGAETARQRLSGDATALKLLESAKPREPIHPQTAATLSRVAPDVVQTGTGAEALRQILAALDLPAEIRATATELDGLSGPARDKAIRKIRLIETIIRAGTDITNMIIDTLLVLPPSLRPMMQMDSGQFASSDLNDLYRKVIHRNNRLRRFIAMRAPEIILRNERRLLQNAADTLLDNATAAQQAVGPTDRPLRSLSDQLRGKKGRFRQNLLGKRVDYSGRSVIVSGPDLSLGQCGLPYDMAAELFRPHLIRKLIAKTDVTSRQAALSLSKHTELPVVRESLDELAQERVVILNRAPTLHRLSMQAFNPTLSDDKVIRLHPLSCGGFNADFDGDQMAVHAPISRQALDEAKNNMRGSLNTISPADGSPSALPSLDIILGIYHMTMLEKTQPDERIPAFRSTAEALTAHDAGAIGLRTPVSVTGIEGPTSAGRIMLNAALPRTASYQNADADKKLISRIVMDMYESDEHGPPDIATVLDAIKNLGFRYAFLSGLSIGVSDMVTPNDKPMAIAAAENQAAAITESHLEGLIDDSERHQHITRIWQQTTDDVKAMVESIFPRLGDLHLMATSGAKGNIENVRQMVGMRGLMSNPSGRTIERPVKSHFAEGLSVFEYFISTHGARKGLADTALRTSDAGYLTRRLVDATHHISITQRDCGTIDGLQRERSEPDFEDSIHYRRLAKPITLANGRVLRRNARTTPRVAAAIEADHTVQAITVRSPLLCDASHGVCGACYGDSLTSLTQAEVGQTVGVIAAQSIGEPGTQLTMRTFHRGGVAGADITNGLPRVEEILEARRPALLAVVCEKPAVITSAGPDTLTARSLTDGSEHSYDKRWQNATFTVEPGDIIEPGDILSTGSAHLAEVLGAAGPERAWKYAIDEIQTVYRGQGVDLHPKHIEIALSPMFAFARVTDPGDTDLLEGETARRSHIRELNSQLADNQKPVEAETLIYGITRSALLADGFLSAASFQRTTGILADASLTGITDAMTGLKENVIAGQLIPPGRERNPGQDPS